MALCDIIILKFYSVVYEYLTVKSYSVVPLQITWPLSSFHLTFIVLSVFLNVTLAIFVVTRLLRVLLVNSLLL